MEYLVTVFLFAIFIIDRIIRNKIRKKSDSLKIRNKNGLIQERTGDKAVDKLIIINNLVFIIFIVLLIGIVVVNAIKWFTF